MKKYLATALLILGLISWSRAACPETGSFSDSLKNSLEPVAGSFSEPCSICVEQNKKSSFQLLNMLLVPGKIISSEAECLFVRTPLCDENEFTLDCYDPLFFNNEKKMYPHVVLKFHTSGIHQVGVESADFTSAEVENRFRRLGQNRPFGAQIRLISYKYGDGPAYNYYPQTNKLQVHCTVLKIAD